MEATLNLGLPPAPEEEYGNRTIDLALQPIIHQVEKPVADNRAIKYDLGLGNYSPGPEQLSASVLNGTEDRERELALSRKQYDDQRLRADLARQYMQAKGADATEEDFAIINALTNNELARAKDNPSTFFEEMTAKRLVATSHGDNLTEAMSEAPELSHALLDVQEKLHWQKEISQKIVENGEAQFQRENPFSKILAYGETFVPFWTYSTIASAVPDAPRSGILPGTIAEDQYTYLLGLNDPKEFQAQAQTAFDEMYSQSPTDAIQWARGLIGFSSGEKYLYNTIGLVDFATVAPLSKIAGLAGKGLATVATVGTVKDAVKATATRTFKEEAIQIVAGQTPEAALNIATRKVLDRANQTGPKVGTLPELFGELNPLVNPAAALGQDSTTLATEHTQRLLTGLETRSATALNALVDPLKMGTIPGERIKTALDEVLQDFNAKYPNMSDTVVGVDMVPSELTLHGADMARVKIGNKEGLPFKTMQGAKTYAGRWLKLPEDYGINKYGENWYVTVDKPIDLTSNVLRDIPIPTEHQTPRNLWNLMFGWARSPNYLLSPRIMEEFNTAAYGSSSFMRRVREISAPIQRLRDKETMNSFLQKQRVFIDPKTGEGPGRFSRTQGEFEKDWIDHTGRSPTENESLAYFAYKQQNDFGFAVSNLGLVRDKLRQGIENHSFPWIDPAWERTVPLGANDVMAGKTGNFPPTAWSGTVEAKAIRGGVDGIPWTSPEDFGVVIWDKNVDKIGYIRKRFSNAVKLKEQLDGKYELFQLTPEGIRALRNEPGLRKALPDGDFWYILSKDWRTTQLDWQQMPYKPGGRIELPDGWFTSQPRVHPITNRKTGETVEWRYNGDENLFNHRTRAESQQATDAIEKGRQMLVKGLDEHFAFGMHDLPGSPHLLTDPEYPLVQHLAATLPESMGGTIKSFKALFRDWGGQLDLNTPFYSRPSNRSVQDFHKIGDNYRGARGEPLTFTDTRDSEHNLYNTVNLRTAMERNDPIHTFSRTGDPELPIFNLRQADMIDPISTLNRSTAALMRDRFIEPLKFRVAENFLAEFNKVLDEDLQVMRKNPLKYLLNPPWKAGDRAELAAAKLYRQSAVNFLGLKNEYQKNVRWMKQRLADYIFEKTGDKGFKIVEPQLLSTVRDPTVFFRSVAFHGYLGLFNPAQLFKQSQVLTHIVGIEGPVRGLQGLTGAAFMAPLRLSSESPEILLGAARRASKMGFGSEAEFLESYKAMRDSGFDTVGGEVAAWDDILDPKTIKTSAGEFLDKGTIFFRGGELTGRMTAWNAAYKHWRNLNPNAVFDNAAQKAVLSRASMLNVDMVNASLAAWNKGFLSLPTQFLNYPTRLAEQFLSRRLTKLEWTRAMATYSLVYGVPVAVGIPTLYPWYEDIRQTLLEKGINYDENLVTKTLVDGIASVAIELSTGEKQNVGSAWGPANPFLKDVIKGDKSPIEIALGASGTQLGANLTAAEPFFMSLVHTLEGGKEWYPVLQSDLENWARNISSVNSAAKWFYAANLGKYMTKEYGAIDEMSGTQGFFTALTGLAPQRTEDIFRKVESLKDTKSAQDIIRKKYNEYIRRGIAAAGKGDMKEASAYFKAASISVEAGGFREDQKAQLLRDALRDNDMALSVGQSFAKGDPARMKEFIEMLRKRGE